MEYENAFGYPLVVAAMATVDMEIRVHRYAKPYRKLGCRSLNSPLSCPRKFPLIHMMYSFAVFTLIATLTCRGSMDLAAIPAAQSLQGHSYMKSWIWGEGFPESPEDESIPISEWYSRSGLITLMYQHQGEHGPTIDVSYVKRPPDVDGPFCKLALPAAIYAFTLHPSPRDISTIKAMTVAISADPYIAACKCYMRTFVAMGFTQIKSLVSMEITIFEEVLPGGIDKFCEIDRDLIVARVPEGQVAHIPHLAPEGIDFLLSATKTLPDTPDEVIHILRTVGTNGDPGSGP